MDKNERQFENHVMNRGYENNNVNYTGLNVIKILQYSCGHLHFKSNAPQIRLPALNCIQSNLTILVTWHDQKNHRDIGGFNILRVDCI